jgi:glycosyltransferase involved in cell wall biosynthesis
MKFLCVIDSLRSGGSQRQLVELATGFKEKGHEVSFLTYHDIPFFSYILEKADIPVTCIEESNYLKRLFKIRKFIRRGNNNVVISFLDSPNFICEFAGFPYRNWRLLVGERSAEPAIFRNVKLILFRWFHLLADYVVANSYTNLEIIKKVNPMLSKSKCEVIYNAINFDCWKPVNDYYPRKNGKIKIAIAATHFYLKNLNGLVEALSLLNKDEQDKILVEWYGEKITEPYKDGSFGEALNKIQTYNLGKVISFFPVSNHIIEIFQNADAIGIFSFYEGFPNIISEGMACRKPIICSAISDLPQILSYNKNLLCDPADSNSIKQAISYLLNLSSDELIQIGLKNESIAHEIFAKEKIVNAYLDLVTN